MENPVWISAVIGAIVGSLATFLCNYILQNKKDKNEKKAIRTLLKIEIGKNIDYIKRSGVIEKGKFKGYNNASNCSNGQKLANINVIHFKNDLWNTKTPLYAIALSESEILGIDNFYLYLERARDLHLEIQRMHQEMMEEMNPGRKWAGIYKQIGVKFQEYDTTVRLSLREGYSLILVLSN